jgi:hypothetical protein
MTDLFQVGEGYIGAEETAVYPSHPGFPIALDTWIEKAPVTVADINNDGNSEILVPTWNGKVYAWNSSGSFLPGFPIITDGKIKGRLALADLDHDGQMEIAAGVESGTTGVGARVFIWRANGTLYPGWPQSTACSLPTITCSVASINITDLNNDSQFEVIAATSNGTGNYPDPNRSFPSLYVWRSNGQLFNGNWPNADEHDVNFGGALSVGDLHGDGSTEIIFGRDYNRLFVYDKHGSNLPGWPFYVWYPYDRGNWNDDQIEFARSAGTLADLDHNGRLEYIVSGLRRPADSAIYYTTDLLVYQADGERYPGWETPASGESLLSQMTWRMLERNCDLYCPSASR